MRYGRLSAQAQELAQLTRELSRCCQAKEEHLFRNSGLSCAEGRVLLCIAELHVAGASEVAANLSISRGRLSPIAESLVRKGFLTRTESAVDRRAVELALTEAGQALAATAIECQVSFHENLLRRFKSEERRQLLDTLVHLHQAMDELHGHLKTSVS